jgi:hypothetical protein
MNSYIRYRLAMTEDEPVIKPYKEALWAELPDARTAPVEISLSLIDGIHHRWVMLMRSFQPEQWQRQFLHPERGPMRLDTNAFLYAWHGRHHVAHIANLRDREGWTSPRY